MVSKEVAQAQQKKQQESNDQAKAKQDAINSSSKQSRSDNRGYNYKDSTGNVTHGADKGRQYTIVNNEKIYNDEVEKLAKQKESQRQQEIQKQEIQKQKEDQTKQLQKELSNLSPQNQKAYNEFLEATAKAGDQKSIDELRRQGRDVVTIKQGPYERTYFDAIPDDTYKELTTGYKDKEGNIRQNYFINPIKSGSGVKDEITFESEFEKSNFDNKKSTDEFLAKGKELGFSDVLITSNGKSELVKINDSKLYDFSEARELSFVASPEMRQQSRDQSREIRKSLITAKDFGFKEVKVRRGETFEKIPIDRAYREILKGVDDYSFVKTPEMRKEKIKELEDRRAYGQYLKESGADEFKRIDNGVISKFPVSDYNKAFKDATPDSKFGIVVNDKVSKQNHEYIENKRDFINYAFGSTGREHTSIDVGSTRILLDNPKNVASKLKDAQLKNPGVEPTVRRSQNQKTIDRTQYEQVKTGIKSAMDEQYLYADIETPKGISRVPINQSFREILKSKDVANIEFVDDPDRLRRVAEKNPIVYAPIVYTGDNPVEKFRIDVKNKIQQFYTDKLNDISKINISQERKAEDKTLVSVDNFFARGSQLVYGMAGGFYNLGQSLLAMDQKRDLQKNELVYTGKHDVGSNLLFTPVTSAFEVTPEKSEIETNSTNRKFPTTPNIQNVNVKNLQQDFTQYTQKVDQNWQKDIAHFEKLPVGSQVADIGIGGALLLFGTPKSVLTKIAPIKYTEVPLITRFTRFDLGPNYYSRSLRFGYGKFNLLLGQKYGPSGNISIGKSRPEISGVEIIKGTESRSSFDTYQYGSFTKRQMQDFDPAIRYLEEKGIIGKGDLDKMMEGPNAVKEAKKNRKIIDELVKDQMDDDEVHKTFHREQNVSFNPKEVTETIEERFDPVKTRNLIADMQKEKMIDYRGGSPAFNLYESTSERLIGDWDFNLLKDRSIVNEKVLSSEITKEGYSLFERGSKIVTGVKDYPIWSQIFSIDTGKLVSGISKESGEKVLKSGINLDDTPRGYYFSTPNIKLATNYLRKKDDGILLEHQWNKKHILKWQDIIKNKSKDDIEKLLAYDVDDRIQRFYVSQDRIRDYALSLKKKYYGAERPYEPGSKFYEVYGWDENAIISSKKIDPTGYAIKKGTEKEFLNLLGKEDNLTGPIKSDKFFGDKTKTKLVKQKTPEGKTITTHDFFSQLENNLLSTSQIINIDALKNFKGDSSKFANIFKDAPNRVGFGTLGRLSKDTASTYFFGMKKLAEVAFKSGNKPLAHKIGKAMNIEYHKHKEWGFDWKNEIAKIKYEQPTIIKSKNDYNSAKSFISSKGQSFSKGTIRSSPIVGSNIYSSNDSLYSKSTKSPSINSLYSNSPKSVSINSLYNKSPKSVSSVISMKSPLMSSSIMSVKSPSMKSSIMSVKSPSMKSPSMKSPSMKSPSTKSPSMKSPSMKSPSMKSPSMKSLSMKSPSMKSPSMKSPSMKSPSMKSPSLTSPSLKSPSLKTPSMIIKTPPPTRTLIIPPFMKFGKHQREYSDKPKYSLTFRWSVKNPVFKKFSINEGKKRRIEW